MTRRLWRAVVGVSALALVVATPAFAQTQEERAAARALVQSRGDAVVMVLATVKLRINIAGREQTVDRQVQANATVLDASGLAVMSLMNLQPDEAMSQSLNRGAQGARVDVTSDIADLTMHLADGRELPAKLVLRDEDLNLAFVRPTDKPSAPLVFVDAPAGTPAILNPVVLIQRTSESTDWKTAASMGTVQLLIDKPRPYYQLAIPTMGGSGSGAPIFDLKGQFVGVMLTRNTGSRGSAVPAVLPAADIRDVAKQAPLGKSSPTPTSSAAR